MRTFLLLSVSVAATLAFKAAVVEHHAVSPCGGGSCGREQNAASVRAYATHAMQAAGQGAKIIVFPEYGITGFSSYSKSSWVQGGYTETIPTAKGQIPCDVGAPGAPSIVSLSCMAKKNGIAVVANLMDYTDGNMFNTDVAFDVDGTLLAKYHKMNLWGESNVDVPKVCEQVSFTTSFGVTFGMFTCADLIYQHPALDLTSKGLTHFVMPAAWSNEMAQMQVIAYAQGWSNAYKTVLLLSNHRGDGESGSGIFSSGRALAYVYAPGTQDSKVLVAEVPEHTDLLSSQGLAHAEPNVRFLLSQYAGASWGFAALSEGKVCSGSLCCSATVSSGTTTGYALAALDGHDTDEGSIHWPAQICAILACPSPGLGCLSVQQPSGDLSGVSVQTAGLTAASVVPEVIASHGRDSEILLTPGDAAGSYSFNHHAGSDASVSVNSSAALTSVIIYGRSLSKDELPYSCPHATPIYA